MQEVVSVDKFCHMVLEEYSRLGELHQMVRREENDQ
jgi:hypothetical protein